VVVRNEAERLIVWSELSWWLETKRNFHARLKPSRLHKGHQSLKFLVSFIFHLCGKKFKELTEVLVWRPSFQE
jgi:hypothetical protein